MICFYNKHDDNNSLIHKLFIVQALVYLNAVSFVYHVAIYACMYVCYVCMNACIYVCMYYVLCTYVHTCIASYVCRLQQHLIKNCNKYTHSWITIIVVLLLYINYKTGLWIKIIH